MDTLHSFLMGGDVLAIANSTAVAPVEVSFATPGYFVALAAACARRNINPAQIRFTNASVAGYATAIGLHAALGGDDSYPHERINEGVNYSRVARIDSSSTADHAASNTNSCFSSFLGREWSHVVPDLKHVVGELHDNVASHAGGPGFSCAQRWRIGGDVAFEFAIADAGLGFLHGCLAAGVPDVQTHEDAIRWCIEPGHTTKPPPDDWAQLVPEDAPNIPMPRAIVRRAPATANCHQGLGLDWLVRLARHYRGSLWVASGDGMLYIRRDGESDYRPTIQPFSGVAVAVRLYMSGVREQHHRLPRPADETIISDLRTIVE